MAPKRSGSAKKRAKAKAKPKPVLSSQELFEAAQEALAFDDFDQARLCFRQCVKSSPDNVEYLDAYGAFLAETGELEEAVTVLRRSIEVSPDAGHEKYMYLGQLLEGDEAVALVRQGIDVLQRAVNEAQETGRNADGGPSTSGQDEDMEDTRNEPGAGSTSGLRLSSVELQAQLSGALCSLAEMLMSLADEPSAVAEEVEGLLSRARAADPVSPEPLQAMASLRYETGRPEEALALLKESLKRWFKEYPASDDEDEDCDDADVEVDEGLLAELGVEAAELPESKASTKQKQQQGDPAAVQSGVDDDEDDFVPSYEFRIEAAKLLLELDDSTDVAVQILEDLLQESDEVPEVWHLLGYAYYGSLMLEEAEEVAGHGAALAAKLGAADELMALFEDLRCAIAEAKAGQSQQGKAGGAAGGEATGS